jgi:hypothetical protein
VPAGSLAEQLQLVHLCISLLKMRLSDNYLPNMKHL